MNNNVNQIRAHYLKNPPDGYSKSDILHMTDDDLLDLDYFLNEDLLNVSPLGISYDDINNLPTINIKCENCGHIEPIPIKALENLTKQFPYLNPSVPCPFCFGAMKPIDSK